MPASSTHNAVARQWELLKLLPSRGPGLTTATLMQRLADCGYPVNLRTIQRDLNELSVVFPLVSEESSRPFLWRWADHSELDIPGLELGEAMSLTLLETYLRPLLPASLLRALEPRFRLAASKLGQPHGSSAARWLDRIHVVMPSLGLLPPAIDDQVLETVQEALLADRQLEIDYRNLSADKPRPLQIHPLALIQRSAALYLVATIGQYQDLRLLAVHRMSHARMLAEPSRRPADFSLSDYIATGALEFGDGATPPIRLRAWIDAGLARILEETPLSADMELTPDGDGFQLTASVNDTWQLRWWLLSLAGQVVVHEPADLRERIRQGHRQALAAYGNDAA